MTTSQKKGFTLVELLVVIAIIGLLSTVAVVSLGSARSKARDAKRIADMKQFMTALEQYYSDVGGYPPAAAATGTALGVASTTTSLCGTSGISGTCTGTTYMGMIPAYPTPPTATACAGSYATPTASTPNYCYFTSTLAGSQSDFKLQWHLEATNTALGGDDCIASSTGISCS